MEQPRLAKNKTINIIGAVILSLLMFGLGQISCGRIKRGIALYIICNILVVAADFIGIQPIYPFNFLIAFLIYIFTFLFVVIDSIIIAKNPENTLRVKPIIGYSLLIGILLVNSYFINPIYAHVIRSDDTKAFEIRTESMMPTILIGDYILVNRSSYSNTEPKRGDIIVSSSLKEPDRNFVRRIIGLSGEIIKIKDKQLYINNRKYNESYINNTDSNILSVANKQRDNYGPITVPEGSLFVLGDNRDNSYNSRLMGFIDRQNIKGKVETIYWSWDKENGSVRWERIGPLIK